MSYAIHPYQISVTQLKKTVGSRDARLLEKLKKSFQEEFDEDVDDRFDDDELSLESALEDLIQGAKLNQDYGYKYGYALKLLCRHFGTMLTNEFWSAMGWDWIEAVDAAIAEAKIDAKIFRINPHLTTRGSPINIPEIADFPSIGYLLEVEMPNVIEAIKSALKSIDDEEVTDSLAEIQKWLNSCVSTHNDLLCFYH